MPGKIPPDSCDGLVRLQQVVHDLRSPGGCPWDREQTHLSLMPNLVEEAYEVVEAAQSGDMGHFCEELGDLLLQVVLHGEIASETGVFDLDRIAHGIAEKLIRRHPHVYGDSGVDDTAGVLRQWDEIKLAEKGNVPQAFLAGVSKALPGLSRAAKLQKKAAKVGFDWPDLEGVLGKLREECGELEEAVASGDAAHAAEELGDVLFSAVNAARKLKLDPEVLMTAANAKFEKRFTAMEQALAGQGIPLEEAGLDRMEAAWQQAKVELKQLV
jgi:MazG family protein